MKKSVLLSILLITGQTFSNLNMACTNFLVSRGASLNGSTMITYAADSHVLYGELYYRPAKKYAADAMFKVYEWDTHKYLGEIKQAPQTYSVIGNMNEFQVAIGETTYGGRPELVDTTAIIDYGSLIYLTLQRARSAREAIKIMDELVSEYGYYSSGESLSIADKDEVWIMEIIGKGPGNTGALWVARKIPEGYVSAHANQARIQKFPLDDPENCLYSEDVISFAREKGYFKGKDKDFSFSDTYAPVDFGGARFCDARVWSFFNKISDDMDQYLEYIQGVDLTGRMPLWIKPNRKLSAGDLQAFMRDHFEGTPLDMTRDIGAGPFRLPYRWRPLTWSVEENQYCNERAIATQQTGFSFVTESRNWLPDWIGGIFWFGLDDAATSVYMPLYCGLNQVPESLAEGNGDMLKYSPTSSFWAFNFVSNFCYLRYDLMTGDVKKAQKELETRFANNKSAIDHAAVELFEKDKLQARQFISDYSVNMADLTFKRWKELGEFLLVKYIDGNVKKEIQGEFQYNGEGGKVPANPDQPGYPEWWYEKIVEKTGDKLKVHGEAH